MWFAYKKKSFCISSLPHTVPTKPLIQLKMNFNDWTSAFGFPFLSHSFLCWKANYKLQFEYYSLHIICFKTKVGHNIIWYICFHSCKRKKYCRYYTLLANVHVISILQSRNNSVSRTSVLKQIMFLFIWLWIIFNRELEDNNGYYNLENNLPDLRFYHILIIYKRHVA